MTTPPTTPQARCERCAGRGAIDVWARSMQVPCPDCSSPTAQTIDQSDSKARCEQIAREIVSRDRSDLNASDRDLFNNITTSLLAAEERGRQEERFRKHDPVAVKVAVDAMWEKVRQQQSEPTREAICEAQRSAGKGTCGACAKCCEHLALALQAERDRVTKLTEIREELTANLEHWRKAYHDMAADRACDWQTEHDMLKAHLETVEESARRVIEQAVQVLATRPITGERHTVLTDLEAWLAEHLAPVKPCPEDEDVQRKSAEKP